MKKTRDQIAARYAALPGRSQVLFLAKLADRLTLMARDTYDQHGGVADSARLRTFNEAQNRILAQLVRLLTANDGRYPDHVFANVLLDQFDILQIDPTDVVKFLERAPEDRRAGSVRLAETGND